MSFLKHLPNISIIAAICLFVVVTACQGTPAAISVEQLDLDGNFWRSESTQDASESFSQEPFLQEHHTPPDTTEPPHDTNPTTDSTQPTPDSSLPDPTPDASPTQCPAVSTQPLDLVKNWKPLDFQPTPQPDTLAACGLVAYRLVAPASMEIQVDISNLPHAGAFTLEVYSAKRVQKVSNDPPLATASSAGNNYVSTVFKVDQSGEIGILLHALQQTTPTAFSIQAFCKKNCQLETTRFPIVLMHGFAGTDKYFGILEYYYKVKPHLEGKGYAVFAPKVQPIANSKDRVLSLKKQIDDIFTQTGARRLNLIAHSQGGVDGRLLISQHQYGSKIASLTTISTPHRGIPIPDLLIPPSQELGEDNMKQYNQQYPDDPQVQYFSWAGVSCGWLDFACRKKYQDEVVDALLGVTFEALKALRGDNDGIVPVSSAKWGTFLGEIPADHFDEIGQIADQNNKSFNHLDFYFKEAQRLKQLGL